MNRAHGSSTRRSRGFTLIELLTVIAIISLLIGMLLPALSRAREQAKKTRVRATLKAIGDGLEMFRSELEDEFDGYPPSDVAEDKTETGKQDIFGAQWLVRFLAGKDLGGYVSPRDVPPDGFGADEDSEQVGWYDLDPTGREPYDRVGVFLRTEGLNFKRPDELPGYDDALIGFGMDALTMKQLVIVDDFGLPILYYRANARQAARPSAYVARYDDASADGGIFTHADNGLFTGLCEGTSTGGGTCVYDDWDFIGSGDAAEHHIKYFGINPPKWDVIDDDKSTFCYYILDKDVYQSTGDPDDATVRRMTTPFRKSTFMLITAGKDGLYGTADDVTNY